jgi:hypothetical protein
MSLSEAWFTERAARMGFLAFKHGHAEIEPFMSACGSTWDDLVRAGLLRSKRARSTAELPDHEPTRKGRSLFHREKDYDILMVKKGMGLAIVDAVRAARPVPNRSLRAAPPSPFTTRPATLPAPQLRP